MLDEPISPMRSHRSIPKPIKVTAIRLAGFEVSAASDKAYQFVAVQTHRANKVKRTFAVNVFFKFENQIVFVRMPQFISRFVGLKRILFMQFLTQYFERIAKLNIHHIGRSKLSSQYVQKPRRFISIRLLAIVKKAGNRFDRLSGFSGGTSSTACKPYHFGNNAKFHVPLSKIRICLKQYRPPLKFQQLQGVVPNLRDMLGTGGGRNAQESNNITFQDQTT
jgi:hypothetical protein